MFGGTGQFKSGDSGVLSERVINLATSQPEPDKSVEYMRLPYFEGADLESSAVSPILSIEVMKNFPPSLLITASRAHEMSAVVDAHNKLTAAGVSSRLHVWDGLGHGFFLNPDLPETREVEEVIVGFFNASLGRPR